MKQIENATHEKKNMETKANKRMRDASGGTLTKRQEMVTKSKEDKQKVDEMRRLG